MNKMVSTIKRRVPLKGKVTKVIHVSDKNARTKEYLGANLYRFAFTFRIDPRSVQEFTFTGSFSRPISGGWYIDNNYSAYAFYNYSESARVWKIGVSNPTAVTRNVTYTIISASV